MGKQRIELMDGLRGLAVLLMVVHHFLYDLAAFCGAPWWLFSNPVFNVLHYIFAGLFVVLSGVSSNFSRSNVKRGLKALACAAVITAVTVWMGMDIWFGILHMLGTCMVFYGLHQKAVGAAAGVDDAGSDRGGYGADRAPCQRPDHGQDLALDVWVDLSGLFFLRLLPAAAVDLCVSFRHMGGPVYPGWKIPPMVLHCPDAGLFRRGAAQPRDLCAPPAGAVCAGDGRAVSVWTVINFCMA